MGQGCLDFLQCTTDQNVILLGMMADASDERMLLTRFMDRGTFDIGFTHAELQQFQERINHLFLSKACLACGYTQVALEFLKRPRALQSPALRTIGSHAGADPASVMQALARMVSWVKVTKQISETEFPEHYLLSTLNVLCLHPTGGIGKRTRCLSAQDKEALDKLAQCFSVDAAELVSQTAGVLPIAQHEMRSNSTLTSVGAWRKALARTQQASKQRKSFPAHSLRPILQYYAIASASTSGVARNFGATKRSLGEQWNGAPVAEER